MSLVRDILYGIFTSAPLVLACTFSIAFLSPASPASPSSSAPCPCSRDAWGTRASPGNNVRITHCISGNRSLMGPTHLHQIKINRRSETTVTPRIRIRYRTFMFLYSAIESVSLNTSRITCKGERLETRLRHFLVSGTFHSNQIECHHDCDKAALEKKIKKTRWL